LGRKTSVDDDELLRRLGEVFRDVGYEGATLTALAKAARLQKASLYHRFPGGKEQMAQEVLQHTGSWLETNVLVPLRSSGSPAAVRIARMVRCLDEFYSGGEQDCLLNALSLGRRTAGTFSLPIKNLISAWVSALSSVLTEAGLDRARARARAERALTGLQGSLVVSRGLGTTRPFKAFLRTLPDELLKG
jgi:AcrR family transcriptional regulator